MEELNLLSQEVQENSNEAGEEQEETLESLYAPEEGDVIYYEYFSKLYEEGTIDHRFAMNQQERIEARSAIISVNFEEKIRERVRRDDQESNSWKKVGDLFGSTEGTASIYYSSGGELVGERGFYVDYNGERIYMPTEAQAIEFVEWYLANIADGEIPGSSLFYSNYETAHSAFNFNRLSEELINSTFKVALRDAKNFSEFMEIMFSTFSNEELREQLLADGIDPEAYSNYISLNKKNRHLLYQTFKTMLYQNYKKYGDNFTHGHDSGLSLEEWFEKAKAGEDSGNCYDYARIVIELAQGLGDKGAILSYGVHGTANLIIKTEDGNFFNPELGREFSSLHDFHNSLPYIHVEHYAFTPDGEFAGEISSFLEDDYRAATIGIDSFDDPTEQEPITEGEVFMFNAHQKSGQTYARDFYNMDLQNIDVGARYFASNISTDQQQGSDFGMSYRSCAHQDVQEGLANFGHCFLGVMSMDLTTSLETGGLSQQGAGFNHNHNLEHFAFGSVKVGDRTKLITRVGQDVFIKDPNKQRTYGHDFYQVGVKTQYFGVDVDAYIKQQNLISTFEVKAEDKGGPMNLNGRVKFQNVNDDVLAEMIPQWQAQLGMVFKGVDFTVEADEQESYKLSFQLEF